MIHRAILGSVERMIAILTEHTGGKWPFWLSPRQAAIVPVDPIFNDYAEQVRNIMEVGSFRLGLGFKGMAKNPWGEGRREIFKVGKEESVICWGGDS